MQKSYTKLWICGLVLAAAVGFFASSVIFCTKNSLPPPNAPEAFNPPIENELPEIPKPKFDFKQKMDSALGLSKEQIAKMDSNGRACDSLRRHLNRQIKVAEHELHSILKADSVDEAALRSIRAKLLLLNEKRLDLRIQDVKFFKSVLTKEQNLKFKSLESKFDKMHFQANKRDRAFDKKGNSPHPDFHEHHKADAPHKEHMGPSHRDEAHKMPPRQ